MFVGNKVVKIQTRLHAMALLLWLGIKLAIISPILQANWQLTNGKAVKPCPTGQTLKISENGTRNCVECTTCGRGQQPKTSCTPQHDTTCEACPSGTFSNLSSHTIRCQACTSMLCHSETPFQKVSLRSCTAVHDTSCDECGEGSYKSTDTATCKSCVTCGPGEYEVQLCTLQTKRVCATVTVQPTRPHPYVSTELTPSQNGNEMTAVHVQSGNYQESTTAGGEIISNATIALSTRQEGNHGKGHVSLSQAPGPNATKSPGKASEESTQTVVLAVVGVLSAIIIIIALAITRHFYTRHKSSHNNTPEERSIGDANETEGQQRPNGADETSNQPQETEQGSPNAEASPAKPSEDATNDQSFDDAGKAGKQQRSKGAEDTSDQPLKIQGEEETDTPARAEASSASFGDNMPDERSIDNSDKDGGLQRRKEAEGASDQPHETQGVQETDTPGQAEASSARSCDNMPDERSIDKPDKGGGLQRRKEAEGASDQPHETQGVQETDTPGQGLKTFSPEMAAHRHCILQHTPVAFRQQLCQILSRPDSKTGKNYQALRPELNINDNEAAKPPWISDSMAESDGPEHARLILEKCSGKTVEEFDAMLEHSKLQDAVDFIWEAHNSATTQGDPLPFQAVPQHLTQGIPSSESS